LVKIFVDLFERLVARVGVVEINCAGGSKAGGGGVMEAEDGVKTREGRTEGDKDGVLEREKGRRRVRMPWKNEVDGREKKCGTRTAKMM